MCKNIVTSIILIILVCSGCVKKSQEVKKETAEKQSVSAVHSAKEKELGKNTEQERELEATSEKEALIHISNPDDFQKYVLDSKLPCLIDVYSDRCPPCRMLAPTIKELAEKYRAKAVVCKVSLDIPKNREFGAKYGIRGIPTVIIFRDGKEVERLIGLKPKSEYVNILDRMIKTKADSEAGKETDDGK